MIGNAHYEVTSDDNDYSTALGEDRFNDGEYDVERDKLDMHHNAIPRMVTFEHSFFNTNGTLQRVSKANLETGAASCIRYENGQPVVLSTVFAISSGHLCWSSDRDSAKGLFVASSQGAIVLHDFNCLPGPEILKVQAYPQPPSGWSHFRAKVVGVDIKPDFGWLNFIAAPFVPEIRARFNPLDDWRFVGGNFTRYYTGPEIILAFVRQDRDRLQNKEAAR